MRLIQLKLFKFGKENDAFQVTVQIAQYNYCNHGTTFRGYQILFSIRNPYMNRFTNHFLFIHNHLALRKWSYTRAQHNFHIDSIVFPAAFEKGRLNIDKKVTPRVKAIFLGVQRGWGLL
jgi:hypothetical protein